MGMKNKFKQLLLQQVDELKEYEALYNKIHQENMKRVQDLLKSIEEQDNLNGDDNMIDDKVEC